MNGAANWVRLFPMTVGDSLWSGPRRPWRVVAPTRNITTLSISHLCHVNPRSSLIPKDSEDRLPLGRRVSFYHFDLSRPVPAEKELAPPKTTTAGPFRVAVWNLLLVRVNGGRGGGEENAQQGIMG